MPCMCVPESTDVRAHVVVVAIAVATGFGDHQSLRFHNVRVSGCIIDRQSKSLGCFVFAIRLYVD